MKWAIAGSTIIIGAIVITIVDGLNIDGCLSLLIFDSSYDLPLWEVLTAYGTIGATCAALFIPYLLREERSNLLKKRIDNLLGAELRLNLGILEMTKGSGFFKSSSARLRTIAMRRLLENIELFVLEHVSKVTRLYELSVWYNEIAPENVRNDKISNYGSGQGLFNKKNEMISLMEELVSEQ